MHELLDYLVVAEGTKKLTVIAIEIGANAFTNYLSRVSLDFYSVLDKVVLINAAYAKFHVPHSNYRS